MLRANNSPCLTCEKPDCPGICDKIRSEMGEVDNTRATHTITWYGVTRPVSEWAEILGVSRQTLYKRLDAADSDEEAMSAVMASKTGTTKLPPESVEETYVRLSTMHLDYILYWNRLSSTDDSAGMVARYGAVQVSPTNATSNPTERRAMPELNMSDEALYRRGWVACVLYMISFYRQRGNRTPFPGDAMRAKILEMRAIDGLTLRKISDILAEGHPFNSDMFNPMRIRRYLKAIIDDVTKEALKRGLIRGTQK